MDNRTLLVNRINAAIKNCGKPIIQIAREVGISERQFYQWKKGLQLPDCLQLVKIAESTGKTLQYFYGNENEDSQKEENTTPSSYAEYAELVALRREVALLHQQNSVLHEIILHMQRQSANTQISRIDRRGRIGSVKEPHQTHMRPGERG